MDGDTKRVVKAHVDTGTRMNASFVGHANEVFVAAALLKKGIHVFRSMTSTSPFDLVAYVEGRLFGLEVRSATIEGGRWVFQTPDRSGVDVVCAVTWDGRIHFKPMGHCSRWWPVYLTGTMD